VKPDLVAIICHHIAETGVEIQRAIRTSPVDPADSGWQFLCPIDEHPESSGKVWLISEVLTVHPELNQIIDAPIGSRFVMKDDKFIEVGAV